MYDQVDKEFYEELKKNAILKIRLLKALKHKLKLNRISQEELRDDINKMNSEFYFKFATLSIKECMELIKDLKAQIEAKLAEKDFKDIEFYLENYNEVRQTLKTMNEFLDKKYEMENSLFTLIIKENKLLNDMTEVKEDLRNIRRKLDVSVITNEKLEEVLDNALEQ